MYFPMEKRIKADQVESVEFYETQAYVNFKDGTQICIEAKQEGLEDQQFLNYSCTKAQDM